MSEQRSTDLAAAMAVAALVVLLGTSMLVLATGEVAGALFGSGSPSATLDDASNIVRGLPANGGDPRLAWPAPDHHLLPGRLGMYGALVLVLLAVALGVGSLGRWWMRQHAAGTHDRSVHAPGMAPIRRPRPVGEPSAAFATKADTSDLAVAGPEQGRVTLGYSHGRLIATEPEHSVLVVGATRSGKTTGYAIPALLEWAGPAIVLSAKTDLLHATHTARRQRGTCWLYDPTNISGLPPHGWSPLAGAATWGGAVRAANAMSKVSGTTAGLGGAGKHWERVAAQLLAPLLLAAHHGGLDMGDVVRWVMTKDLAEPHSLLELLGSEGDVALTSMQSYVELEPRARDSAFSTARTALDAYEDPDVVTASTDWDIRPEALLDGGSHTVFLVAGSTDQSRLAPVFLALLDELLREAFLAAASRRARTGSSLLDPDGGQAPRLLLLLDEAANIAPLPDLATLASTAGGEGIQLVTIYQDLSQLRHRYGTEWGSIASNHVAKVVLPGVTDPETLAYFANTIGDEEVVSRSTSVGADGRRTTSSSVSRRAVLSQRGLRELQRGEGVCLYGSRPPIRFRLRPPGNPRRGG